MQLFLHMIRNNLLLPYYPLQTIRAVRAYVVRQRHNITNGPTPGAMKDVLV